MDLSFTEEQRIIQETARKLLENECNIEFVRRMWEDNTGCTPELWNRMAEMGWLGITIPEEYDGMGLGFLELGIILDEMGRVAMPGPFLSTVIAAQLIADAGSEEQKKALLPRIAMGEIKATLALGEPVFSYTARGINLPATVEGGGFVLNGKKQFVLDGLASDLMIVAARTHPSEDPEQGVTLFLLEGNIPGVSKRPLKTMDGGRKQCEVTFENVGVPASLILGQKHAGWPLLKKTLTRAALAVSMENLGGGQRALDMAVEYAKIRIQFDRPIGSFQAVKHTCAQGLVELEGSRSICYYGAWAMDHLSEAQGELFASVAKAYSSEMYRNVTANGTQVLGAIGVTWEHDMHLYLKRAKMNESLFGDPGFHRERVAQLLNC
jgi:alkylation response protein AidB-like acyl-CoA dehydrogenase